MDDFSEFYVDGMLSSDTDTYNPETRSGTTGAKRGYKTLNTAINSASAEANIYVRSGTYAELGTATTCFPINKNITIQAFNSEAVTLTYPVGEPPLTAPGEFGYIIRHNCNVNLSGLTIIGTREEGNGLQDTDVSIQIDNSGSGEIHHCTFQKWGHAAIKLGTTGGAVSIHDNDFQAGGFGIRDHHIYPSGDYRVNPLTISNNAFSGATGWGIHLYGYAYGAVVSGNNIHDNWGGVVVTGEDNVITENIISDNLGGKGVYLFHYGLKNLTIKNNICSGNTPYDLFLDIGEGEGLSNCTIENNAGTRNF